jgi:hypothetical protein
LPLAVEMHSDGGLAEALDHGFGPMRRPRGPLARACTQVLDGHRLLTGAAA